MLGVEDVVVVDVVEYVVAEVVHLGEEEVLLPDCMKACFCTPM